MAFGPGSRSRGGPPASGRMISGNWTWPGSAAIPGAQLPAAGLPRRRLHLLAWLDPAGLRCWSSDDATGNPEAVAPKGL